MGEERHYFYVLYCQDNSLYAGYTNHLGQRLQAHNSGKGAKYTRPASRRPVRMIYAESYGSKTQAMRQEYWFKQFTRLEKEAYLRDHGQANLQSTHLVLNIEPVSKEEDHANSD